MIENKSEDVIVTQELTEKKRSKKPLIIVLISVGATLILLAVALLLGIPYVQYCQAVNMMENGQYEDAIIEFEGMGDYLKSEEMLTESKYLLAKRTQTEAQYVKASEMFKELGEYKDSKLLASECDYLYASQLLTAGDYQKAFEAFGKLNGYKDSADKILECKYLMAEKLIDEGKIVLAYNELTVLGNYGNSKVLLKSIEPTYKLIIAKPKLFVNKEWDEENRSRVWVTTKVIDENTLKITVEGSNGTDGRSIEELTGKWNESTGMVEFTGKAYLKVYEHEFVNGDYVGVEKTYCEDANLTGKIYYKNGYLCIKYDKYNNINRFI